MLIQKNKTVLSFIKPTPAWATWAFRIVFLLTTATTIVISSELDITDQMKVKLSVYLKAIDFVIWGIGRGIGVSKEDFTDEKKEVDDVQNT